MNISELTSSLHDIEAELRRLLDRRGLVKAKPSSTELTAGQRAIAREVSKRLMKRAMTATEAEVGQAMEDPQALGDQ